MDRMPFLNHVFNGISSMRKRNAANVTVKEKKRQTQQSPNNDIKSQGTHEEMEEN